MLSDTSPASDRRPGRRRCTTDTTMHRPRSMSVRRALPRRFDLHRVRRPGAGLLRSRAPAPHAPPPEQQMAQPSPHKLDTAPRQLETTAAVMLTYDGPRDRTRPPGSHFTTDSGMGSRAHAASRPPVERRRLADAGRTLL